MTMRTKTVVGVLGGMVVMVAAVAAQQPAAPGTTSPAAVLDALKRPTAPSEAATTEKTEDDTSMAAVLARYNKMIAVGEATPTPAPAARPPRATAPAARAAARSTVEPASETTTEDTLDAIRADLQAIIGRLEALARKGGQ